MKLKEYAAELSKLAKKHPDIEVMISSDDEGNSYRKAEWVPELVYWSDNHEEVFYEDDFDELRAQHMLPEDLQRVVIL